VVRSSLVDCVTSTKTWLESSIQTVCGTDIFRTTTTLRFADLQGPPPSSAYFQAIPEVWGQVDLWPSVCRSSICEDRYYPQFLMPSMITDLEPAFKTCTNGRIAVWDPPIALSPTRVVAPPVITATWENSHLQSMTHLHQAMRYSLQAQGQL
jgi:hypothetical protein